MKILAGLGNPGDQYYETRHNAGFRVIDLLATMDGTGDNFQTKKFAFSAAICQFKKIKIQKHDVLLLKPLNYMNLSGVGVKAALNWFKLKPSDLLVIHDEVSLPLGKIRLQENAGAGGQHGVENIIEHLGNNNFARLRVGVGPDPGGDKRADYVLGKPPEKDQAQYQKVLETSAEAAKYWLGNGTLKSANIYNGLEIVS
ncbi:MAG: aminoacyl-tRNA hydrolase [Candidatus Melainabacteria bacterium]|nr:aminoacyl-tRNA hydrolase [Candidatus Melainabacteria bacterium]